MELFFCFKKTVNYKYFNITLNLASVIVSCNYVFISQCALSFLSVTLNLTIVTVFAVIRTSYLTLVTLLFSVTLFFSM